MGPTSDTRSQAGSALQHCRGGCGAYASKCSSDNPPKPMGCGADPNLAIVDYNTDASWKCPKNKCSAFSMLSTPCRSCQHSKATVTPRSTSVISDAFTQSGKTLHNLPMSRLRSKPGYSI